LKKGKRKKKDGKRKPSQHNYTLQPVEKTNNLKGKTGTHRNLEPENPPPVTQKNEKPGKSPTAKNFPRAKKTKASTP